MHSLIILVCPAVFYGNGKSHIIAVCVEVLHVEIKGVGVVVYETADLFFAFYESAEGNSKVA